jgi:hypothetical protein
MSNLNDMLSKIESARLWNYFHKDWLLQMRQAIRDQLPVDYRVFLESEAVLISPDAPERPVAAVLPDISIARQSGAQATGPATTASCSTAVIEAEESCELETHYSLIIRRSPDNFIVAALELLSPSNKGVGNRWDREKHLLKRAEYLDAGISVLELDALRDGERDLPAPMMQLAGFDRVAWTAFHHEGKRRYRGYGWNQVESLPQVPWQIDPAQLVAINLPATLDAAAEFNRWEEMVT